VQVVEGLVLAEGVRQVRFVHDQIAVEEFGSAGAHSACMIAFIRGTRSGLRDGVAAVVKDSVDGGGVSAVAVSDQVLRGGGVVVEVGEEIPG
jgi:hypothetical protein